MTQRSADPIAGTTPADSELGPAIDPAAFVAGLERIRSGIHRWVDRIEELSHAALDPASGRDDQTPGQRELEQQRDAMRVEQERREQEWADRLESIENDRRLLAEAWVRLEQEHLAALELARVATESAPKEIAAPRPRASQPDRDSETENEVDRAILRQFEALRQDVRGKAGLRRIV